MLQRHDRRSIFNVETHGENQQAHNVIGGSGESVFRLIGDNNIFGPSTGGNDGTTGSDNIVAGDGAGVSLTGGFGNALRNLFMGLSSGASCTEGSHNVGLSTSSLTSLTIGDHDIGIGSSTMHDMIDGTHNFASISSSMFRIEHGNDSISIGSAAMFGSAGADVTGCIALGNSSLFDVTTAQHDIGAGQATLRLLTSGDHNLALIDGALGRITTGDGSLGLGKDAGDNFATSSARCGAFGYESGPVTQAVYTDEMFFDTHTTDTPLLHLDTSATHLVTITGDLTVTGTVSKGGGSFVIEHPLDDSKELRHGFVEAPEYGLEYSGEAKFENGIVRIDIDKACDMMPGTFAAIARKFRMRVQNISGFTAIRPKGIDGGILTVIAKDESCNDVIHWFVFAERKDAFVMDSDATDDNGSLILEPEKSRRGNKYARDKVDHRGTPGYKQMCTERQKSLDADREIRAATVARAKKRELDMEGNLFGKRKGKESTDVTNRS